MPAIRLLPELLINQIAAGEVIERPAAALKELLENSLDAGATDISVQLDGGGIKLLRVRDNGTGIARDELPLALMRHATSKIASLDDLQKVASMGFRGEALASMAAVAQLTLTSRTGADTHGWKVEAIDGRLSEPIPASHAQGTTVEIREIYFNTPARRKFLKSESTEFAWCEEAFKRIALSRPDVAFSLQHNGRTIWQLSGSDGEQAALKRVAALLGEEFGQAAVPVSRTAANLSLQGLAALPALFARQPRCAIFFRQRPLRARQGRQPRAAPSLSGHSAPPAPSGLRAVSRTATRAGRCERASRQKRGAFPRKPGDTPIHFPHPATGTRCSRKRAGDPDARTATAYVFHPDATNHAAGCCGTRRFLSPMGNANGKHTPPRSPLVREDDGSSPDKGRPGGVCFTITRR